jgi:hypothetical protein
MWLMERRGIPDNYISDYMESEMYKILLPEEEQKRKRKMDMDKTHASYMNRMKSNNNMNTTHVMHMTMQGRRNLL